MKISKQRLIQLIQEEIEESIFDRLKQKAKGLTTAPIGTDIASHKKLGLDVEELNLEKAFEKIADLEAKVNDLLSKEEY